MHLLRGLVSASLIAGCSIGPTGGASADLVGSFGGSGKADGTDVWEILYDDATGETIYRGIDYGDAEEPFIFAEQVLAEIEPSIYQYISTFPGQGSSVFAFVDPEVDGTADAVALDVLPLDQDIDLTLAQLETFYHDSVGSDGDGKADLVGSSCGWHMFRLGGALSAAGATCWWSYVGGPGAALFVCGGALVFSVYEAVSGSCPSSTSGSTSSPPPNYNGTTPNPSPSPRTFPSPPPAPAPDVRRPLSPREGVRRQEGATRNGTPVPYPREYRRRSDQQGSRG